ncbi:DUF885 domain-containing protein [Aliidiomarina sp. Khilg15.8]
MKKTLLAAAIISLLAACQDAPPQDTAPAGQSNSEASSQTTAQQSQQQSESERLNEWFNSKYEESLQMSPMQMTRLGRKDRYDEIDDVTVEAEQERLEWMKSTVEELQREFDYDQLNDDAKISYDIWMYQYELMEEGAEFREDGYVFDQMRGAHSGLPQLLLAFHSVDNESDMEAYISRIGGIGNAMRDLIDRAERQAENGIRPPRFAYEHVKRQAQALITGVPFDDSDENSPIYNDALDKIETLQDEEDLSDERAEELRQSARTALTDEFGPAYTALIEWLKSDMQNAGENTVGISRHEGGDAFYKYRLKSSTTTDLTADEIHQIGLEEVERLTNEMVQIKEQVEFDGDLAEFFEFIRTDERFYYPNTDEGREAYLEDAREYLAGINEQLPEFFGILPKADLVVRRVEPYREQDGAPQHYYPGSPDGQRPGIYYAHLSDMGAMPKNEMEAIAYHEGNPGHHMQISIAQELEGVPQFRTQARFTVYSEGWALYSELLAKEMGGYEDPYSDFGRLVTEMWRAVRLVVDTGMHAKGWTQAEAVAFFSDHTPVPEAAIRSEIERYLVMPGQATSYKIGMLKIEELRAYAEEELGDDFDIRGFHDTILGGGAMPLPILERRVQQWVRDQKA